ncbi:MAG: kynurenine formamidase [Halioglobus sp.]|jgi:kynurenine formamidase
MLTSSKRVLFYFSIVATFLSINTHADELLKPSESAIKHPSSGPWWPSRWGADDELGAANHLSPDTVLAALAVVKTGAVADLAHPFEMGRPDFHNRVFTLISAGGPSGGPVGKHRYMFNEEWISGEITGMSTQFDALSHIGRQLGKNGDNNTVHYYNGFSHSEIGTRSGFKKLGVEKVPPIFTLGILIDLAAHQGSMLAGGQVITIEDLKAALEHQGMTEADIRPGSVVLLRQGRDRLWYDDPNAYVKSTAGLNKAAADWLASKDVVAVGSDSVAMEPIPPVNDRLAEIHATLLMENGIYGFENLDLRALSEAKAYQFAFSFAPIPFVGAQGSPARPFAIY